jgi:hypothetical protein
MNSIGRQGTPFDYTIAFFQNLILYFDPVFLFFQGDPNLRHSTQFSGQLSWLDTFALIVGVGWLVQRLCDIDDDKRGLVWSKEFIFVIFFLAGILSGLVPAALTDTVRAAHALRAVGAWPFITLLTGYILWKMVNKWKFVLPCVVLISITFSVMFLRHYFFVYPRISYESYNTSLKNSAQVAKTLESQTMVKGLPPGMNANDVWERIIWKYYSHPNSISVRYFLMNYLGEGCSQSRKHFLDPRKLFSSFFSAEEYNAVALQLAQQGDYEEAVKHFSAAIQKNPDYVEAYKNLGMLWSTLGQSQKALDSLAQAHQILLNRSAQTPELQQEIDQILETITLEMQKQKADNN